MACPARGPWRKINAAVKHALEGVTLAEIVTPFGHALDELPAGHDGAPENRAH
jgi:hypothetical protein